jgi:dTDP-glucose 4,6-dehydratase
MKTLLITGGCGFIGSNFIRYALGNHPDRHIVNLDKLTYAGNPNNLATIENDERYTFVHGDVCDAGLVDSLFKKHSISGVIHFAAETHVDRSILGAAAFIDTNIKGTMVMLDAVRRHEIERFIHISTDEVYGDLGAEGYFTESSPLHPNSPYAASKAGADLLVQSYVHTFKVPAIITRSSNNYGPYQFPEKLIPLMILNTLHDKKLPVYGDGSNVRDWIYVEDNCRAIDVLYEKGRLGEAYNIGAGAEMVNIDVVKIILSVLGKKEDLIEFVKDRPGHDRRYAMDITKIREETGWTPGIDFNSGIGDTIRWYRDNEAWWRPLLNKDFEEYKKQVYKTKETTEKSGRLSG